MLVPAKQFSSNSGLSARLSPPTLSNHTREPLGGIDRNPANYSENATSP